VQVVVPLATFLVVTSIERKHLFAQRHEFRRDGRGQLENGLVASGCAFLGQMPDADVSLADDLASVGGFMAKNHVEQRGLARAVRADETDAIAAIQLNGGSREEGLAAVGFADVGKGNHGVKGKD